LRWFEDVGRERLSVRNNVWQRLLRLRENIRVHLPVDGLHRALLLLLCPRELRD
jgi:hypothetical protein